MSLRRKACSACVAAKRRCDQESPACRRCTKQHLACKYPFTPLQPIQDPKSQAIAPTALAEDFDDSAWADASSDSLFWDSLAFSENSLAEPAGWDLADLDLGYSQLLPDDSNAYPWTDPGVIEDRPPAQTESRLDKRDGSARRNRRLKNRGALTARRTANLSDEDAGGAEIKLLNNPLIRPTLARFWPRVRETDTWSFCASELLSYIGLYSKTASTPFIVPSRQQQEQGHRPPLISALGVCAAHETLAESNSALFAQLLEAEVLRLIESPESATTLSLAQLPRIFAHGNGGVPVDHFSAFREELARVQALTLYQIMRLFGSNPHQRRQAEQQEPLLASWTTSLQLRMQIIDQKDTGLPTPTPSDSYMSSSSESGIFGEEPLRHNEPLLSNPDSSSLQREEVESAHRTILMSYFVRAVYAVLAYGICPLIVELQSLRAFASRRTTINRHISQEQQSSQVPPVSGLATDPQSQGSRMESYKDLIDSWEQGSMSATDLDDQYIRLLLVACKGVKVLASRG